jgi:hypothetical protein
MGIKSQCGDMCQIASRWATASACFLTLSLVLLNGCQQDISAVPAHSTTVSLHGRVFGGQRPISNSSVLVYAAGTNGIGSSAEPLMSSPVLTDGDGNFSIAELNSCPTATSNVYVVAKGGNPGLSSGTDNAAIALMAMLGPCGALSASTEVSINEVTTIGSVSPVSRYMQSASKLGSTLSDPSFSAAVELGNELVDMGRGVSPGNVPANLIAPTPKLNSLANALSACVDSSGGVAGDGSICGRLFGLATPPGSSPPTDTAAAAKDIAQNPTIHVSELFDLVQNAAPYTPALESSPEDWALALTPTPTAPVILPAAGTYAAGQAITITSATSGAVIHYTLDGSAPTTNSPVYSVPLVLSKTETVTALSTSNEVNSPAASAAFTVTPAHLIFSTQPPNTTPGTTFTPVVEIVSASGTLLPNTTPITLSLAANPGAAVLTGTSTVAAVKGIASFPGLSVSAAGAGYTLSATDSSDTPATSAAFTVSLPALSIIDIADIDLGVTATGSISLPAPAAAAVAVSLSSNLPAYVSVSTSLITIAKGQSSSSFTYTGNGPGIATLTATAPGYSAGIRRLAGILAVPTILPAAGAYAAGQAVTLSSSTLGAVIHYTLDGSTPTATSPAYAIPLVLSAAETVHAIAVVGSSSSAAASAAYTIIPATPGILPAAGAYASGQAITLTSTTSGAVIHYTLDGSTPTATSPTYSTPLVLSAAETVHAIAVVGSTSSAVASAAYTVIPAVPAILPAAGAYASGQAITLTSTTSGAVIHYTLDGSTPTATSSTYSTPLVLSAAETIHAIAVVGSTSSAVASAAYTVIPAVPGILPAAGAYASGQAITLTSTTSGAVIHYTLDGSTPTAASPTYSAPLILSAAEMVQAIAVAGSTSGAVASASFTTIASATVTLPLNPTFYIANSGSDANNGTTPTTPWKTIAKLNATSLVAGSSVYLQCGSTFRETLALAATGTASLPVSYASFGSCTGSNLPLISGADLLSTWTAESEGSFTAYYATEATAPSVVFEDNHRLPLLSAKTALTVGSSFYDATNKRVYVRSREDANPTSHVLEANVRSYAITGYRTSYLNITGIEADKAALHDLDIAGSLTNVTLTGMVTNYAKGNGVYFTANTGEAQNNILIQNGKASYNGGDGVSKGNGGTNVVVSGYTANYNAFDPAQTYTGGIRLVSDGTTDANRPTFSGIRNSTTDFNGVNPDTSVGVSSTTGSGVGVWCDTCGNGSFITGNEGHGNTQAGAQLEWTGATGSQSMTGNIEWNNFYGVLHTRRSHNDLIANNTTWGNFINCQFSGEYGGGETTVGMVNNTYENNICASQVMNSYGTGFVAEWGAENNTLGEGSGNVYRNNSFGVPSASNGTFAMYGRGVTKTSYAQLNAAYGSSMNSITADPLFTSPSTGNFTLLPGSPAIAAGVGAVDLGAVPYGAP